MNKKGFTLVELLAVVTVLALLIILAATNGFGALNKTKAKLNEEQSKSIKEGLNLFLLEVDKDNCIEDSKIFNEAKTILIPNPPSPTDPSSFNSCSEIQDYIGQKLGTNGEINVNLQALLDTGYVTGSSMDDFENTGDLVIKIKGTVNQDPTTLKYIIVDGSLDVEFEYEQYNEDNNKTNIALYLDPVGGDDSNKGNTSDKPIKTISKAIDKAGTKNLKIYLMNDLTLDNDYTHSKNIIIVGNNGRKKIYFNSKKITSGTNSVIYNKIEFKNFSSANITETGNVFKDVVAIYNYEYTGNVQSFTAPTDGKYKLEVWGAEGGYYNSAYRGGKGGYSTGMLNNLEKDTYLYIHVGGYVGQITTTGYSIGGYNGGGKGYRNYYSSSTTYASPGGGATDIRLSNEDWNDEDGLYSRIIVAGGGSGAVYNSTDSIGYQGYAGGGIESKAYNDSYKATSSTPGTNGKFGIGADALKKSRKYIAAAGGGGWQGGGRNLAGNNVSSVMQESAGGSGYIYTSSSTFSYPEGQRPDTKFYLSNATTLDGTTGFTNPNGDPETGHSGSGYARITLILE